MRCDQVGEDEGRPSATRHTEAGDSSRSKKRWNRKEGCLPGEMMGKVAQRRGRE